MGLSIYFDNLPYLPAAVKSKIEVVRANMQIAKILEHGGMTEAARILTTSAASYKGQAEIMADYRLDLEDIIAELPAPFNELYTLHYLQGKTWEETAAAMKYSPDYARKDLHRQALEHIERRRLLEPIIKRYGGAL